MIPIYREGPEGEGGYYQLVNSEFYKPEDSIRAEIYFEPIFTATLPSKLSREDLSR